ncbi:uncharacterized protein LOC117181273 [Belonocnema kinseyi]|uniref:uncharacterized protein LOC117181273 n=1 Tax=Belonocnema kinseyi TaxID=2817044 RepID=UPI00143CCB04|nr:uncharacterized protein LOC117181273 [Belonocnema kinseyi]
MTCNPNWREIQENLLFGQQASDRPDICARVFDIKKKYLFESITRQQLFGEVQAQVHLIEFQKRGLPHMHLLVTLKQNCKFVDAMIKVDNFLSAEIPDPCENKTLHEIVMKNMIRGPCGDLSTVNGKYSKHFHKTFQPETVLDDRDNCFRRTETKMSAR